MALRAGYYGVKIGVLRSLNALGKLGIKKLGSMFNVSNTGELTVRNATKTIPGIVKLEDITGGVDYSTNEQNTGVKWVDGKTIYQKTFLVDCTGNVSTTVNLSELSFNELINIDGCFKIINASGITYYNPLVSARLNDTGQSFESTFSNCVLSVIPGGSFLIRIGAGFADTQSVPSISAKITLQYTKD